MEIDPDQGQDGQEPEAMAAAPAVVLQQVQEEGSEQECDHLRPHAPGDRRGQRRSQGEETCQIGASFALGVDQ